MKDRINMNEKMNIQPIVSIVMPVYNAREFVEDTVDSILMQSYKDFELIIVDDGSTDGSYEICKSIGEQDGRVKVFHQSNHGLCYSRNRAIEMACGKYIAFCDHDDYYEKHYLKILVNEAENNQVQLVKGKYKGIVLQNGKEIESVERGYKEGIIDIQDLLSDYRLFSTTINVLWNGLYLSSIIKNNDIRFDERFKNGCEDNSFNLDYLTHVKAIAGINNLLYTHVRRVGVSASLGFKPNRIDDYQVIFKKEALFLEQYRDYISDRNYMRHQSRFINLLRNELQFDDCPWTFTEKTNRIMIFMNSTYEFKKIGLKSILQYLMKNRQFTIRWLLYHYKCCRALLLSWKA